MFQIPLRVFLEPIPDECPNRTSGDANDEWMGDDEAVIPVLSVTREADGSAEEQPESTKSAIAFDIALNWQNVGLLL